jgi:hypothetical protein
MSQRSVSTDTANGGDGVIGRLQPGQVTVGKRNVICMDPPTTHTSWVLCNRFVQSEAAGETNYGSPRFPSRSICAGLAVIAENISAMCAHQSLASQGLACY